MKRNFALTPNPEPRPSDGDPEPMKVGRRKGPKEPLDHRLPLGTRLWMGCKELVMSELTSMVRSQSGSAYIVVLLVLVVLSVLALSLTLMTQTEVQIAANERAATRVFYSADAGIELALARALVTSDHRALSAKLESPPETPAPLGADRVEISRFHPILDAPCNLCTINQGSEFFEINHAVTAQGFREGINLDGERVILAEKTISAMVEFQPWRQSVEAIRLEDPEEVLKIKF